MTTTPEVIQRLVAAALAGRTDAADRVYTPRTWPTRTDDMPDILVRLASSDKQSLGRGDVQFTVTDTVEIVVRAASLAAGDDTAVLAAEAMAWRIQRQVEVALLDDAALMGSLQQIPFMRTQVARNSDGQQTIVGIATQLGAEYYQGPEDFGGYEGEEVTTAPLPDLEEVRIASQLVDPAEPENPKPGPVADVVTV